MWISFTPETPDWQTCCRDKTPAHVTGKRQQLWVRHDKRTLKPESQTQTWCFFLLGFLDKGKQLRIFPPLIHQLQAWVCVHSFSAYSVQTSGSCFFQVSKDDVVQRKILFLHNPHTDYDMIIILFMYWNLPVWPSAQRWPLVFSSASIMIDYSLKKWTMTALSFHDGSAQKGRVEERSVESLYPVTIWYFWKRMSEK